MRHGGANKVEYKECDLARATSQHASTTTFEFGRHGGRPGGR